MMGFGVEGRGEVFGGGGCCGGGDVVVRLVCPGRGTGRSPRWVKVGRIGWWYRGVIGVFTRAFGFRGSGNECVDVSKKVLSVVIKIENS